MTGGAGGEEAASATTGQSSLPSMQCSNGQPWTSNGTRPAAPPVADGGTPTFRAVTVILTLTRAALEMQCARRVAIADRDLQEPRRADQRHGLTRTDVGVSPAERHATVPDAHVTAMDAEQVRDRIPEPVNHDHLAAEPAIGLANCLRRPPKHRIGVGRA
jgi:hypothetical protein